MVARRDFSVQAGRYKFLLHILETTFSSTSRFIWVEGSNHIGGEIWLVWYMAIVLLGRALLANAISHMLGSTTDREYCY